jgi:predicted RNase H-like HicB family nuclease
MLRYHVAFHLPRASGEIVVAEALDFPGAVTQRFDLADARLMIASALEDLAQLLIEEGNPPFRFQSPMRWIQTPI